MHRDLTTMSRKTGGWIIILGNAKTEWNGHKEGKTENIELVETMRILQREVFIYKELNERIISIQEDQKHINTQLLKVLNILYKKINKEWDSRKEEKHRSHARRENERSFGNSISYNKHHN
jgi:hypothetical protein